MTNEAVMEKYYSMAGKYTEREIAESMGLRVSELRKIKSKYLRKRYSERKERVKEMLGEKLSVYKIAQELSIPESSVRMYIHDLQAEGAIKE